jgi:6-phosphogluconolactonase
MQAGLALAEAACVRLATFPWERSFAVLGMGNDGHIASLFASTPPDVRASPGPVVATRAPEPPHERLSLSLSCILAIPRVVLLVVGKPKLETLERASVKGSTLPVGELMAHAANLEVHLISDP